MPVRRSAGPDHAVVRPGVGRVVTVSTGVLQVRVRGRLVRASFGGGLLARIAEDPTAEPRVGDRVRLAAWSDGRLTCERVLARPV